MKRRNPGDMSSVRATPKKEYPYKDAPFDIQQDMAWRMFQSYRKQYNSIIPNEETAFKAGVLSAFGWIQTMKKEKHNKRNNV